MDYGFCGLLNLLPSVLYLRIITAVLLFGFMFYTGYVRRDFDRYFSKKFDSTSSFNYTSEKFPQTIEGFQDNIASNYKWVSSCLYSLIYVLISVGIIWVLFQNKKNAGVTLVLYLALFVFSIILILIGNLFGSYKLGYGLAQNIKRLIQSPLLTFFLIIYFWKIKPTVKPN